MDQKGRFITLEGGEGTGKSTLIAGLSEAMRARHMSVVATREPGGTVLAEEVRRLALFPPRDEAWSPLAHALLMNTSRDDHLEKFIRPQLADGNWVLCDRFSDSTRAYQSVSGVAVDTLIAIENAVVGSTRPDLTLVLDGDPERLADRRQKRGVSDVFEDKALAFHQDIRAAFLEIAERAPERCVIIDAEQAPDAVLASALMQIEARLGWP